MTDRRIWLGIVIGGVLLLTVAAIAAPTLNPVPGNRPSATDSTTDAKIICNSFMKDRLKSPASASFASYGSQSATTQTGGAISVKSYVDSQNGFGANIRTTYTCTVRQSGGDWSLVSLTSSP